MTEAVLDAAALATSVRGGQRHPVDIVAKTLADIERHDRFLGAFQILTPDRALAAAEELSRRDLDGLPLAGVPVAIKDNCDVAGLPTRNGSLATPGRPASRDAGLVARLKRAGALVVGKTRVPELCIWPFTESLGFGATRNPWDPTRSPGGSSGGSAAAVAAGFVPVAIGSDGLGSLRIPAAMTNLVALKPGRGVVPRTGVAGNGWWQMSEFGPLARSVGDLATAYAVIAGTDPPRLTPPEPPLRIAFSARPALHAVPVDGALVAAARAIAALFAEAGHEVVAGDPPRPWNLDLAVMHRWTTGVAQDARPLRDELLEPRTRWMVRAGWLAARGRTPQDLDLRSLERDVANWFGHVDVLVTPTVAQPALRIGAAHGRGFPATVRLSTPYGAFTGVWNLLGYPAMSVPAGRSADGMPAGAQLVARPGRESLLLQAAALVEARAPWTRVAPGVAE